MKAAKALKKKKNEIDELDIDYIEGLFKGVFTRA
jgi:hypothetical protein